MPIGQIIVNEDGMGAVLFLQLVRDLLDVALGDLEARPSIPLEAGGFAETTKTGDETSRGHGEVVLAIIFGLDGNGKAIGDQQKSAGRGADLF